MPLESGISMKNANTALKAVREYLSNSRDTPISCSSYTLPLSTFTEEERAKILNRFNAENIDWDDFTEFEFLRFVFRQAGQDELLLTQLPNLISSRF